MNCKAAHYAGFFLPASSYFSLRSKFSLQHSVLKVRDQVSHPHKNSW